MIGIFYPYLASASRWDELRYSLRSLDKFFNEDFEVWIVGDMPEWIRNVKHIPHQKTEMTKAGATYDAVSKLKLYIDHDDSPHQFLRMYDDVYLTGTRTVKQMQITRYLFTNDELNSGEFASGGIVWRDQVFRSTDAVVSLGYPGYMTETHCPEVFEKMKMRKIFEMFDPLENRLLTSTLYFNVFPYELMLKDRKVERALFYGYESDFSYGPGECEPVETQLNRVSGVCAGKYYLNHNDDGLDDNLKKFIRGMFPDKCRFEK
ncbi:MAG TPA: hypothetical protein VFC67_02985 [Prolixibacteraceae bacterium]|nr:hypothetical protein [Prolixibacteraceae bacterium]